MKTLICQLHELIGKSYLPPKWDLGFLQSIYSYKSTSEVEAVFDGFKKNDIQISAIHLHIDYMKGYRVFTLNENFSEIRKLADKMQKEGSHVVAILNPIVKYESGCRLFDEGLKNRYFVKGPHGNIIKGPLKPGFSSFPDFTDSNVRD